MKDISNEVKEEAQQPTAVKDFVKEYEALCDRFGLRIVVTPLYIARDDGSFSTVLQYTVDKLPVVTEAKDAMV